MWVWARAGPPFAHELPRRLRSQLYIWVAPRRCNFIRRGRLRPRNFVRLRQTEQRVSPKKSRRRAVSCSAVECCISQQRFRPGALRLWEYDFGLASPYATAGTRLRRASADRRRALRLAQPWPSNPFVSRYQSSAEPDAKKSSRKSVVKGTADLLPDRSKHTNTN